MEALRLIPQSFFEFFARLVPGIAAFALWFGVLDGSSQWADVLRVFTAGYLDTDNVSVVAITLALAIAYAAGQLAAPLGKWMQRLMERIIPEPAPHRLEGEITRPPRDPGDYDWLRANAPQIGALVAKIRAEHTMFYSLSAIFLAGLAAKLWFDQAATPEEWVLLPALAAMCALRGHSVETTMKETGLKLRVALDPNFALAPRTTSPP